MSEFGLADGTEPEEQPEPEEYEASEREEVSAWLAAQGARPDTAADIRRKVVTSRGEHDFEAAIAELWDLQDEQARVVAARERAIRRTG